MEFIDYFKSALSSNSRNISKLTLKNYLSDLRHFINWYEKTLVLSFSPQNVTPEHINLYAKAMGGIIESGILDLSSQLSAASLKRHQSSLKKYFSLLASKGVIKQNPFEALPQDISLEPTDYWHLKSFKDSLIEYRASKLTVKNYLSDISSFARWYEESILPTLENPLTRTHGFYLINHQIVAEYKKRLQDIQGAAPRTINRKLSSIRKYLEFAQKKGFITLDEMSLNDLRARENEELLSKNEIEPIINLDDIKKATEVKKRHYSSIPPFRLIQRIAIFPYLYAEEYASSLLSSFMKGKKVIGGLDLPSKAADVLADKNIVRAQNHAINEILGSRNIGKDFFASESLNLRSEATFTKILNYAKHTRPEWYKRYHSYAFVHYVHFALLIIFATGVGVTIYQTLIVDDKQITYASNIAPPRVLSFQGRLTDDNNSPITTPTDVRFAIYNSLSSTGSALLWQEVHTKIAPESDGAFSVLLGTGTNIESSLFSENSMLYLGITVEKTPELTPRQRIATVAYASNSEFLNGMKPITTSGAGTTNVILALDTSGNLTIGGSASTTFSASGGQFKISGQPLVLATNLGSNGNVSIIPDGLGKIDIQKALINTTNNGNLIPGGVEVNDRFGVLATESAVAAFIVNNNTTGGDIFTASSSGTPRFTIANDGGITDSFYNTAGGILYTNSSGVFSQTLAGVSGQCLLSSGAAAPVWGACDNTAGSPFGVMSGAIVPNNSTVDLLIGGQATSSAKFSVTGIASNNTTASLSGNLIVMASNGWGGNVGIGTNAPSFKLHVSASNTSTSAAMIENTASNIGGTGGCTSISCHTGLNIKLGAPDSSLAPGAPDRFINFMQGDGTILGKIRGTNTGSVAYDTAGGDFAEYFKKSEANEALPPGSIVCFKDTGGVTLCDNENRNILGVVSDVAGFVGNSRFESDSNYVLVGLSGQVPTFMSNENGEIKTGDPLSSSKMIPGAVAKATSGGKIVGRAIESFDSSTLTRVDILVQPSWYDPGFNLTSSGNYTIEPESNNDPLFAQNFIVKNEAGEAISSVATYGKGIFGSMRAGIIESTNGIFTTISSQTANITDLTANSLSLGSNSISIAGKSIEEFIIETVKNAGILASSDEIVSPLASIDRINTNIISPLSTDTIIVKGNIEVKNAINQTVARIDTQGNATFSGTLEASSSAFLASNITNLNSTNATISGTLYAQNIQSNNIVGLDDKISSIASSLIASAPKTDSNYSTPSIAPSTNFLKESIYADFGIFEQGITSFGSITAPQVTAMESLSIGSSFIIDENSINTLGHDLEIQSLRQGNISFMGGLIKMDTDGNLSVKGNLNLLGHIEAPRGIFTDTVKAKSLATSLITPLPGEDLVIKLNDSSASNSGSFIIQNKKGQNVVTINNAGDIHSSGSANISKLNFSLVGQAEATSLTQAIATGSAGFATLRKYQTELTIKNSLVTEDSLIYITPYGDTSNKIIYLLRQTPTDIENNIDGSFTVGISGKTSTKNIQFNWLIVN